jgi:hypothetical protein
VKFAGRLAAALGAGRAFMPREAAQQGRDAR